MKKVTVKDLDKRIGGLEAKIDKLVDAIPSVKVSDIEKCLKQELEVGKWYYATEDEYKWLFNYVELNKEHGRYCGYGFDLEYKDDIIWNEQMSFQTENECKFSPAKDKEVEEALIKEAKKRGFKEGAWFNCIDSKIKRKFAPYSKLDAHVELTYKPNNTLCHYNGLTTEYGGCSNPDIFRDGKWAEIIEDKLEINGKEVTIEGDIIKIGCKAVHKGCIEEMVKLCIANDIGTIHHEELGDIKVSDLKALIK